MWNNAGLRAPRLVPARCTFSMIGRIDLDPLHGFRRRGCLLEQAAPAAALLDDIEEFYFEDQRRARLDGRR